MSSLENTPSGVCIPDTNDRLVSVPGDPPVGVKGGDTAILGRDLKTES